MGGVRLNAVETQTKVASMAKISLYSNPTPPLRTVDSMVEALSAHNNLNDDAARAILNMARKAILNGELHSRDPQTTARVLDRAKATPLVTPQEFNDWVVTTGMTLKLPALMPKRARTNKSAVQTNNWRLRIQKQATQHMLALRKGGANPTVLSILRDIHAWCVQNNVKTPRGIVPSEGYIRTHVLGGKYWSPPP